MPRYAVVPYKGIREVLAPEYRELPAEQIEALVRSTLGDVDPEDVDDFLGTLKKVGGFVAKAAPSVLPVAGTVVGTAFGGPLGATLGGTLGSLAGKAVGGAAGPGPRRGRPGLAAAPAAGGSPAAGQLLALLNRPEIIQALMAMLMGPAGRSHVPVGGTAVPVGAVANLVGTLANQAAAEHNAAVAWEGESSQGWLLDARGEFLVDPAVPEERAERLLQLLQTPVQPRPSPRVRAAGARYESDPDVSDDQIFDELELAELYAEYENGER